VERDILKRQAEAMIRLTHGTGYSDAFRSLSQFRTDGKLHRNARRFPPQLFASSSIVKQADAFKGNGFVTLPTK
jgi:hypothetical protein